MADLGANDDLCRAVCEFYFEDVASYVRRLVSSPEAAEDILQETFEALVREIRQKGLERIRDVRFWCMAVARRRLFRRLEAENRQVSLISRYGSTLSVADLAPISSEIEDRDLIRRAYLKLKIREVSLLIDKYEKHLTVKEISAKHNMSESKIRSELYRIRIKIKA